MINHHYHVFLLISRLPFSILFRLISSSRLAQVAEAKRIPSLYATCDSQGWSLSAPRVTSGAGRQEFTFLSGVATLFLEPAYCYRNS